MGELEVISIENGVKTYVERRVNDKGERVKITRKVRLVTKKVHTNHAVAERMRWQKFGHAAGAGSEQVTGLGEEILLKLGPVVSENAAQMEKKQLTLDEQVKRIQSQNIKCKTCGGDHFTAKCPYKETLAPLTETIDKVLSGEVDAVTPDNKKPGRYVPPSLQARMAAGGASTATMTPSGSGQRQGMENTLRVTNLSDDCTEDDMYRLFSPFGPLARVFVSTDRDTGRCRGFAFISFRVKEHAERARQKIDGHGFDNLVLQVDWSDKQ